MARNRTNKRVILTTQNTWVQVPVATTGKKFFVHTDTFTPPVPDVVGTAVVEIALSVASPGGAGTVLPKDENSLCSIENAATHTLWARRTDAGTFPVTLVINPQVNGNVLSVTA